MNPIIGPRNAFTETTRQLPTGMMLLRVNLPRCEKVLEGSFPWRIWAVTSFQAPDETGFPMEAEAELIRQGEDELVSRLSDSESTLFLGNMTHDGRHVAVLYSKDPKAFCEERACRINSGTYEWDVYTEEDPGAQFLRQKFLLTPDEQRHLQDREVLDALAQAGDNSVVPRPITFYGLFPDEQAARQASAQLEEQGFCTTDASRMPGNSSFPWSLMFQRTSSTESGVIDQVSALAADICRENGGHYDGWSCEPVGP